MSEIPKKLNETTTNIESKETGVTRTDIIKEINNAPSALGYQLESLNTETVAQISEISENTRSNIKLEGVQLHSSNDNLNFDVEKGVFVGPDDGHTFGLGGQVNIRYYDQPIKIAAGMDSYTSNPYIKSHKTGDINKMPWIDQSKENTGERIDRGYITVDTKKEIYNNNDLAVQFGYGAKLTYDGDLGGQELQNKWHETGMANYNVYAPYEENGGFGGNINLGIDARKKLTQHIYAGVNAQGSINVFGSGNTSGEVGGYAGVKYKYAEVEAGMKYRFTNQESSKTISLAQSPQNRSFGYVKAALGSDKYKLFYEVNGENGGQGTVGLSYGFEF